MAKIRNQFCIAVAVAVVVAFAAQNDVLGQSKSWNADQLSSPFPAPQTEKELIEQLRSDSIEAKAMACKQLAIYGGKDAVPELAKLLDDKRLASWSRIALEAIPDPAADAALIEAAKSLEGKLLVGVINSLGERRSEDAIEPLADCLSDQDEQVAAAAAVALGKIGNEYAVHTLHGAFANAKPDVKSAIAEGGILCAERMVEEGNHDFAVQIYDVIRNADLPKQRILEATRGAILARGAEGIPLLVEQLESSDKQEFHIGLSTARELEGAEVVQALSTQLANATPERAALILYAIGDVPNVKLPQSVLRSATSGDKQVRLAAVEILGRLGDASAVPTLLEIATDSDGELAAAAKKSLAGLPSKEVDAEIVSRLSTAKDETLGVLVELVGERRIEATDELVKALESSDEAIRSAALAALGETVGAESLDVLIEEVLEAKDDAAGETAERALLTASIRMPNRDATAKELAAVMPNASQAAKASLLRTLGAMGGPAALETIADVLKSGDEQLQDVGTKVLGEWMTADAAPVLLEVTSDPSAKKYHVRALRGYLRIARQLKIPDEDRIAMCRKALEIAQRPEERELALDALKRSPSKEAVELASSLLDDNEVRERAVETAIFIGEQIKEKDPAAAKAAGQKALEASPPKELAERARALVSP